MVRTSATGEVEWTMTYDWLAPCFKSDSTGWSSIGFVAMNQQFEASVVLINPANGNIAVSMPWK